MLLPSFLTGDNNELHTAVSYTDDWFGAEVHEESWIQYKFPYAQYNLYI